MEALDVEESDRVRGLWHREFRCAWKSGACPAESALVIFGRLLVSRGSSGTETVSVITNSKSHLVWDNLNLTAWRVCEDTPGKSQTE